MLKYFLQSFRFRRLSDHRDDRQMGLKQTAWIHRGERENELGTILAEVAEVGVEGEKKRKEETLRRKEVKSFLRDPRSKKTTSVWVLFFVFCFFQIQCCGEE